MYLILAETRPAVRAGTKEKKDVLTAWRFLKNRNFELLSILPMVMLV